MEKKLKNLSKENLQNIILEMAEFLPEEQCQKLDTLVDRYLSEPSKTEAKLSAARMSQKFVDEKMEQFGSWMQQIDEGELYLNLEEYEDYSSDYWNRNWVVEYYDNQGIGDKLLSMIQFAKDCVDDRRYQEANGIYEWLWEMTVSTDSEYDSEPVGLDILIENNVVRTNIEQLALLALYTSYQVQRPENRAEDIYLYFSHKAFRKIQIGDMFHVGRENLTETEQFWTDWIRLLKTKQGDVEARLLQEAVLYQDGIEGLAKMADENYGTHPSLYLAAIKEYDKNHDYEQIEQIGERALGRIDSRLIIRSEVAAETAYASYCLAHMEKMMQFSWEQFLSDSTVRNYLRLFGMKEMAEQYGMRGKEVFTRGKRGESESYGRTVELRQNVMGSITYNELKFYTGDFETAKQASKNPEGSLGWSSRFIGHGIRLFLLYLYENPLPSKAAAATANRIGFPDDTDLSRIMGFEGEIIEESRRHKTSIFWNYFKRWKQYFPMEQAEQKKYLAWAEKTAYQRTDAIVGGQHRGQYEEVAVLLAMVGEIKEQMGMSGAKREIFAEYKKKFPRHSSFQSLMRTYFNYS